MTKTKERDYIRSLDGIRSLAIIMIVWYHFWQQNWLTPYINLNNSFTRYLGITTIELATFVRFGYYFVDLLILLSAVVNFLPYAKAIVNKTPLPKTKDFYIKRASRILPSYYLALIVMFIAALVRNGLGNTHIWKDLFTHITCTAIFFKDTYQSPDFNGVLWTVQLEVIYYLLIPFIAKAVKRFPAITVGALYLIGLLSANIIGYNTDNYAFFSNFFLSFAGYYASGIVITLCYYSFKKTTLEKRSAAAAGILLMIISYLLFRRIVIGTSDNIQFYQLVYRFPMMLAMSGFVFGTVLAEPLLGKILGNKVFVLFAGISYNLYIWHQEIAVFMKKHQIPSWDGLEEMKVMANRSWQVKYLIAVSLTSILFAVILTYFFERPISKLIRKKLITSPKDSTTLGTC